MAVRIAEDRSMCVNRDQAVATAWIDIDLARLGSRVRMAPEAVKESARRLVNIGPDHAAWPPIVGSWGKDGRFIVWDGRHEYLAALMLGRERLFVGWIVEATAAVAPPSASAPIALHSIPCDEAA